MTWVWFLKTALFCCDVCEHMYKGSSKYGSMDLQIAAYSSELKYSDEKLGQRKYIG